MLPERAVFVAGEGWVKNVLFVVSRMNQHLNGSLPQHRIQVDLKRIDVHEHYFAVVILSSHRHNRSVIRH